MRRLHNAFLVAAFGPLLSFMLAGCSNQETPKTDARLLVQSQDYSSGRLIARFKNGTQGNLGPGLHLLNISTSPRDGMIYVPSNYQASKPAPLLLFLHGNRGTAQMGVDDFIRESERTGIIFLFPDSRKRTWDRVIDQAFGPDAEFVDEALQVAFNSLAIDRSHVGIGGFSDGASYSLSLGQTNGDLFTHIIAFSPGGSEPASQNGRPPVFIIHGFRDDVLPIDKCSRLIVPELVSDGYTVTYTEFDGRHQMTSEGKVLALDWFLKTAPQLASLKGN